MNMKKMSIIGVLMGAAIVCAAPISLHQSQDKGLSLAHMDWLLSDAAENEPDRVDQSAATKRALTLADQLAVLLPTPDASCRSASLSRRSGDVPRRGPRPARACHYFASL